MNRIHEPQARQVFITLHTLLLVSLPNLYRLMISHSLGSLVKLIWDQINAVCVEIAGVLELLFPVAVRTQGE